MESTSIILDGTVFKADGTLLSEREFSEAFLQFMESKGWMFGGLIQAEE